MEETKEQQRALERERARQNSRRRRGRDFIGAVVGGGALMALFSDSRLKENITLLPYSEYETIGLQSFSWMWSFSWVWAKVAVIKV